MRDDLKKLDDLTERLLHPEHCENCTYWEDREEKLAAVLSSRLGRRPGVCGGQVTGMFGVDGNNAEGRPDIWTWSDFGCCCFAPKEGPHK